MRRIAVGMKRKKPRNKPLPELPAARPMPGEASPGGIEGADPGWTGGSSNLGEVLNEPSRLDTTYSTKDAPDVPKVESVRAFLCNVCGESFESEANLNIHRRTHHRTR